MSGLTRERIVEAALELLDEAGLEGISTRGIAQKLGVQSPALYWHFKNKRELLDAMAAAMLSPETYPGPSTTPEASAQEWLAARAHAFRTSLLGHRDGAAIHAGTAPPPAALPNLELRLASLVAAGLTPVEALRTTLAIARFTVGWVLEEQAEAQRGARALDPPDPQVAPVLAEALGPGRPRDRDAEFDFGLRALIAGVFLRARGSSDEA